MGNFSNLRHLVTAVSWANFARCYFFASQLRHRGSCHLATPLPSSTILCGFENFLVAVFTLLYSVTGGSSRMPELYLIIGISLIVGSVLLRHKAGVR